MMAAIANNASQSNTGRMGTRIMSQRSEGKAEVESQGWHMSHIARPLVDASDVAIVVFVRLQKHGSRSRRS
jgi:hypothetical protein